MTCTCPIRQNESTGEVEPCGRDVRCPTHGERTLPDPRLVAPEHLKTAAHALEFMLAQTKMQQRASPYDKDRAQALAAIRGALGMANNKGEST